MTAEHTEARQTRRTVLEREKPRLDEPPQWKLAKDTPTIRIAGPAGAGKTTIADALSRMLEMDIIKVGQQDRKTIATDTDFRPRDPAYDRQIDEAIQKEMLEATTDNPVLIDSHLSLVWGRKTDKLRPDALGISILVIADEDPRMQRIMIRQNEERRLRGEPPLTLEQTRRQTLARHKGNLALWRQAHPNDVDSHPHVATDEDKKNKRFIIIDTTDAKSRQETINLAVKKLVEAGVIERHTPPIDFQEGVPVTI